MSLFKIYGITYSVFFFACIIACWFVPTHIFPSEMSELTNPCSVALNPCSVAHRTLIQIPIKQK